MLKHKPHPSKILPKDIKEKPWKERHDQRLQIAIDQKSLIKQQINELGFFLDIFENEKVWVVRNNEKRIARWLPDIAKFYCKKFSKPLIIRDMSQFINAVRMISNL